MSVAGAAQKLLKSGLGSSATFRGGQVEAIEAALTPGSRTLVVQKTGWGKSLVYFIATKLLRDEGNGPTLLVSPLLSLMRNQEEMAQKFGVRAATINSTNKEEWEVVREQVANGLIDLLMVSPERLGNQGFVAQTLPYLEQNSSLLVIDEAHCISDWGHDFRPDYRRILSTVNRLPTTTRILGTTATANDRVIEDVRAQLGDGLEVIRGPLMRESLHLKVFRLRDRAERLAFLAKYVPRFKGTGVIYALTINDVRRIADWLKSKGIDAEAYHADLANEERIDLEGRFQRNEIKALCATTALGMGYDKGDVAFIVHFQRPGSVISYYQQIGRAGRAIDRAEVVLLEGGEDDEINEYFIASAFPGSAVFEGIAAVLLRSTSLNIDAIVSKTNFTYGQVSKALKLMEVEGAARYENRGYVIVDTTWNYSQLRSEEVMAARRRELAQMQEYSRTKDCRMSFLACSLDDPSIDVCRNCDACVPHAPIELSRQHILEAIDFLRADNHVVESKFFFPPGAVDEGRKKIPDAEKLEAGIALCVYNDAGWGTLVRAGKYEQRHYSDELIGPAVKAIGKLAQVPEWLTWVPSQRQPTLVASFATRLAAALGIPAVDCVRKSKPGAEQKEMQNSTTQFANAWNSFMIDEAKVMPGACILVDDVVDSGWTLTAIGVRLRRSGSGPVLPFALATARPRDDK